VKEKPQSILLDCRFIILLVFGFDVRFHQHILLPKEFCRQKVWEALSFGVMKENNFNMYTGVL
jgi:hypothetical protein